MGSSNVIVVIPIGMVSGDDAVALVKGLCGFQENAMGEILRWETKYYAVDVRMTLGFGERPAQALVWVVGHGSTIATEEFEKTFEPWIGKEDVDAVKILLSSQCGEELVAYCVEKGIEVIDVPENKDRVRQALDCSPWVGNGGPILNKGEYEWIEEAYLVGLDDEDD